MGAENEDLGYHPEEIEIGVDVEKVFCFLDGARVCSAECTAYQTHPNPPNKYLGSPAQHCVLLTNMERVGRHLPIIAQILDNRARSERTAAQDAERTGNTPKVDPRPAGPFATSPFPVGGSKP